MAFPLERIDINSVHRNIKSVHTETAFMDADFTLPSEILSVLALSGRQRNCQLGLCKKITCEHVCGVRLFAGVKLPWWLVSGLGGRTLHGNDCRCILLYIYICI